MKTFTVLTLVLTALAYGCSTASRQGSHAGTTRITVSGTSGAVLTGFYVQDGRRVAISNAVPWSLEVPRLSGLELQKVQTAESVVVDLRYTSDSPHAQITTPLVSGVVGIRVEVRNGLIATTF